MRSPVVVHLHFCQWVAGSVRWKTLWLHGCPICQGKLKASRWENEGWCWEREITSSLAKITEGCCADPWLVQMENGNNISQVRKVGIIKVVFMNSAIHVQQWLWETLFLTMPHRFTHSDVMKYVSMNVYVHCLCVCSQACPPVIVFFFFFGKACTKFCHIRLCMRFFWR